MAFNWKTFQTRTLTAAIFVVVMLAGLLINEWSFFLLFSLIHFGCWWEFLSLVEKIRGTHIHPYSKFGFMFVGYGFMLLFVRDLSVIGYPVHSNFSFTFLATGTLLLLIGILATRKIDAMSLLASCGGFIYISLSCGLMMYLYKHPIGDDALYYESIWYNVYIPVFIIACMWINDTMAYIVGSLIGKTPFSKISPKKTWEGTIGGIFLCALIVGYFSFIFDEWFIFGLTLIECISMAALAAIAGTLGDLFESKLKRMANVKDSGSFMPGHGGFLDRFDSLLFATPVVWLCINLF